MLVKCAICLGTDLGAKVEGSASSLPCGHVFHSKCVRDWFNHSGSATTAKCPTCRQAINKNRAVKLFLDLAPNPQENDPELAAAVNENLRRILEDKEDRLKTAQRKCEEKEKANVQLRQRVIELEQNLSHAEMQSSTLALVRTKLQKKTKEFEIATDQVVKLRKQLESCRATNTLMTASVGPNEELEALRCMEKNDIAALVLTYKKDSQKLLKKNSTLVESLNRAENTARKLQLEVDVLKGEISVLKRVNDIYKGEKKRGCSPSHRAMGGGDRESGGASTAAAAALSSTPFAHLTTTPQVKTPLKPIPRIKNRSTLSTSTTTTGRAFAEAFDGLGGHSRLDAFPRGKIVTSRVAIKKRKLN